MSGRIAVLEPAFCGCQVHDEERSCFMVETLEDAEHTECSVDGARNYEGIWHIHQVVGASDDHDVGILIRKVTDGSEDLGQCVLSILLDHFQMWERRLEQEFLCRKVKYQEHHENFNECLKVLIEFFVDPALLVFLFLGNCFLMRLFGYFLTVFPLVRLCRLYVT